MRNLILGAATLLLLASCNGKKSKIDPFSPLTNLVDSANESTDSISTDSIEEIPQATRADETFNDFIFTFASDKAMQEKRIHFPLTFKNNKFTSQIEKRFWKNDNLFTKQSFYTMLFDNEADMDLINNKSLRSAQFEWIFMKAKLIKQYNFKKNKGAWMLESINLKPIETNESENFIEFFHKFANDSIFQRSRTHTPLAFVTTDPDDDFSILETTMEINQWFAFEPSLPKERLSNINYGQKNTCQSNIKVLSIRGVDNGFSNTLYFRRIGKEWEFYKFEDLSN